MSSYKPLPLKLGPKGARVLLMFTGDGVINAVFPERAADGGARHHLTRLAHTEAECSVARSWATASSTSSAARIPQRTRSQPARQSLRDTKTNSPSAAGDYGDPSSLCSCLRSAASQNVRYGRFKTMCCK